MGRNQADMASQLYQKQLPMLIRSPGRDDRRAHIWLTMEMERYPGLERGRTLIIRLTDENDLFFLHTLRMAYDDFHVLKEQEKILIDFDAFPRQIIDFLDLCIQEEFKQPPKYILHFHVATQQAESRLDVVETNEFQHITRLKFSFFSANDEEIKKYLAECLKIMRQEKKQTEVEAEKNEKMLAFRLENLEENLRKKTEKFENLQKEFHLKSLKIHENYSEEREKAAVVLRDFQTKCEEEKKNLDLSTKRTISKLEAKNYELETVNKDLAEKKSRMEGGIQELKDRFMVLEEDLQKRSAELQICRRHLNDSQTKLRDGENFKSTMDEQERRHQESIANFQDRISVTQSQVEKLEKTLKQKEIQISRLQKDVQLETSELNKANDIIRKMQLEQRTVNEKLKIRSSILVQQEKLLEERKTQLESAQNDAALFQETINQKEKEISQLKLSLFQEKTNLAETEKLLENNSNVIFWLNRQLNVLNGRSIQTLHPATTVSSLTSRFADLNVPGSNGESAGYRRFHSGTVPSGGLFHSGTAPSGGPFHSGTVPSGGSFQTGTAPSGGPFHSGTAPSGGPFHSGTAPSGGPFHSGTAPSGGPFQTRTTPSVGSSSRSASSSDPRGPNVPRDDKSRDPVVDEKYLQSPLPTRPPPLGGKLPPPLSGKLPSPLGGKLPSPLSGKLARNLTPTSALKTVSSAYFT